MIDPNFPSQCVQPTPGRLAMREAVARYMSHSLYGGRHIVNPEQLIIGAGCNAVLENLCFAIAEPGSAVLVPAPYYAAFDFDLASRAGMAVVPVRPGGLNVPAPSFMEPSTYYPTARGLDAAYDAAEAAGTKPVPSLANTPSLSLCLSAARSVTLPPSLLPSLCMCVRVRACARVVCGVCVPCIQYGAGGVAGVVPEQPAWRCLPASCGRGDAELVPRAESSLHF